MTLIITMGPDYGIGQDILEEGADYGIDHDGTLKMLDFWGTLVQLTLQVIYLRFPAIVIPNFHISKLKHFP